MESSFLSQCDLEPIHMPSAIQEFGALAVVSAQTFKIVQVSTNAQDYFGLSPELMLGKSVSEIFADEILLQLVQKRKRVAFKNWVANVWYQPQLILIEAEVKSGALIARIEADALDQIQKTETLAELLTVTADSVARLTGLDRVMIYRFHEDLHGEVVAEFVMPGVDSYLGLHYPANDIPLPARAVFLKNWVRMIPNVNYRPVGLTPKDNPVTRAPLDLGASLLRAVSPVHIEYLHNMKVSASLTISLIVDGKLWGLIASHALEECYIPLDVRDACETIGRMSSAFIGLRIEADINKAKDRYHSIHKHLVENMHGGVDMARELTLQSPNLLDLIVASGTAAALYLDGYWASVGNIPSETILEEIVDWLNENHADKPVFVTDSLASQFSPARHFKPEWCGMMALSIPKTSRNYILWFRPELVSTVSWAGRPEKIADEFGRLHPRTSFNLWSEEVSGKSVKWTEIEQDAALELRNAIMAVDLQRQYKKEQEARIEAERATKAREELMAVLSHDLKNPLGSIRLGAQFATKFLTPDSFEKVRAYLNRIEKSTANMDALITDILSVTKLEAGHLESDREVVNVSTLILEVIDLITPIANEKRVQLSSDLSDASCETSCDRGQMFQVISNILGNAIKFTPDNGKITVALDSCGPEFLKISVTDTGPGIAPENLANVFDRFWQANQTKRLGTGLGLAIVKGIVEAHGGRAWAESDGKSGTTFHITLPMQRTYTRR